MALGIGSFDVPVLATIQWPALLVAMGAMIAVFRFKAGVLPVLGVCSAPGAVWAVYGP